MNFASLWMQVFLCPGDNSAPVGRERNHRGTPYTQLTSKAESAGLQVTVVSPRKLKPTQHNLLTDKFVKHETVGKMIAANVAPGNPYQAWLGAYGDPAYSETVKKAVGLADRLAARETAENRARMTENYLTSCRLEWILWDAAWRLKGWPF